VVDKAVKSVLVVGKNSSVWNLIRNKVSFISNEVSHADVKSFDLDKEYDVAIVFSYSDSKQQNAELLSALSVYARKIVYISSMSCEYAEKGYRYNYPRIKLFCERYIKEKKNFESYEILRIGLVKESYENLKLSGCYYQTSLLSISERLDSICLGKRCSENDLVVEVNYPFSSRFESLFHAVYKFIQRPSFLSFIITRMLDVGLKVVSVGWYGYSEKFK
jgi:hypothetical protein